MLENDEKSPPDLPAQKRKGKLPKIKGMISRWEAIARSGLTLLRAASLALQGRVEARA
jgi:hypothetical protein